MRIRKFLFEDPSVLVLLFIYEQGEVRYKDLELVAKSRGTLSYTMRGLISDGLVRRRVNVLRRPVKIYYTLTARGKRVAKHLNGLRKIMVEIE